MVLHILSDTVTSLDKQRSQGLFSLTAYLFLQSDVYVIQCFYCCVFTQLNDCHRGVVFDSLDTLFSQNYYTTANCILKALNNRKYLYFITLKLDYNMMKEQERKRQQEQGSMFCYPLFHPICLFCF